MNKQNISTVILLIFVLFLFVRCKTERIMIPLGNDCYYVLDKKDDTISHYEYLSYISKPVLSDESSSFSDILAQCIKLPKESEESFFFKVSFIIEKDGRISTLKLVKGKNDFIDLKKLERIIPKFLPARLKEENISSKVFYEILIGNKKLRDFEIIKMDKR